MRTYREIEIIRELQKKEMTLFTLSDFARLFSIDNQNTLYKKIQRLEKRGAVNRLIKGKYELSLDKPNEFTIANFLYQPSYISLESALSLYGIITGFPYQITSITTKRTKSYLIEGKEYHYTQINAKLFWGYEKNENFLIADKEKSLLDYLYLAFKGQRNSDLDEFQLEKLDKSKLNEYVNSIANKEFRAFAKSKIC